MSNLRQAAEALLNHWEAGEYKKCTGYMAGHIRVLREALAHEALDRMVAENQRLGLYECAACKKKDELIKLLKEEVGFAERGYTKRNDV